MSVISKLKLLRKLRNKEYRDAYVEEKVATSLPFQIRALREQPERDWSQGELGRRAGMRQNAISRLEDAESGTPSISTLLRLARAFDVALLVKFVPFSKLLHEFANLSSEALSAPGFEQEIEEMESEAISTTQTLPMATSTDVSDTQLFFSRHDVGHTAVAWGSVQRVQFVDWGTTDPLAEAQTGEVFPSDTPIFIEDSDETPLPAPPLFRKSSVPLATELIS